MKVARTLKNIRLLLTLAALAALLLLIGTVPASGSAQVQPLYARGRIVVQFKPGASAADRAALHRAPRRQRLQEIPGLGAEVVRVQAGAEEAKAAAYARSPFVAYAEPDYIAYALDTPNDPSFANQWGLDNTGQAYKPGQSGTIDADIDAPEAWAVTTGSPAVVIAILDTGIDQDHPELAGKIVGNKDYSGYGVEDRYGHGTHVAGIAAAMTNNGVGVAGVGRNSSLLNVKVLNDQGSGYYTWIANGVTWAADHGAKVINLSLGGTRQSPTMENAINYAWDKGIVIVAAAGNDGSSTPFYPANCQNAIAVAATDANDQKASFSNYGSWVEVAAPGVDIFSTFPNHPFALQDSHGKVNNYDFASGTSMATPHVAGLAALIWAKYPTLANRDVRARIEDNCDAIPDTGTYWTYGRINACKAVGGGSVTFKVDNVSHSSLSYNAVFNDHPNVDDNGSRITVSKPLSTTPPPTSMHVGDLQGVSINQSATTWAAIVTITIHDANHNPVANAVMSGTWSGSYNGPASCTTDGDGRCSVTSGELPTVGCSYTPGGG